MARRGFFAELQHQAKIAAREQAKQEREEERARKAAIRETQQMLKAQERDDAKRAKAKVAEQKRLDKEAKLAHMAAMEEEAEEKNLELARCYDEIDGLLAATLNVDDFVDLETLRQTVKHPPYSNPILENPIPPPEPLSPFSRPTKPSGLKGLFGKKKYEQELADAQNQYDARVAKWNEDEKKHEESEANRLTDLENDKAKYAEECKAREHEVQDVQKSYGNWRSCHYLGFFQVRVMVAVAHMAEP